MRSLLKKTSVKKPNVIQQINERLLTTNEHIVKTLSKDKIDKKIKPNFRYLSDKNVNTYLNAIEEKSLQAFNYHYNCYIGKDNNKEVLSLSPEKTETAVTNRKSDLKLLGLGFKQSKFAMASNTDANSGLKTEYKHDIFELTEDERTGNITSRQSDSRLKLECRLSKFNSPMKGRLPVQIKSPDKKSKIYNNLINIFIH